MIQKKKLNPDSNDAISLAGILHLHLYDRKNELLWKTTESNLIVTLGYHTVAKALAGVQNSHITQIAIGSNGTPPEECNLEITDSLLFDVKKITYPKPGIVRFYFEIGYGAANGMNICEFGLITAGNRLFSRKTRELIEKTDEFRIAGYWDIVICDTISEAEYYLALDGETYSDVSFDAEGGSREFTLTSSHPWTALPGNLDFVSIHPLSGPAGPEQSVTITVVANPGDGRSAIVAFDNEIGQYAQVHVHQAAAAKYTLTIDRQNDSQPDVSEHYAGTGIAVPEAPYKSGFDFTGYRWSANNALVQPGAQLTMPSAPASLTAEYIATPPPQPAYIRINGETGLSINVGAAGSTQTVQLDSSSAWEVTDPFAFGSLAPESGPAGDEQSIAVTVSANTGDARSDTVVFTNEEGEYCQLSIAQAAVYWNVAKSGTATKECPSGQSGSSVTYTVAAHTYSSTVSQAAADALAQADVNTNKQGYANQYGTCTLDPVTEYTVTYNAQGGSAVSGSPFTVAAGSSHQIRSSERPSYELDGWATSPGGSVAYTVGQTITVNGNITLYAKWTSVVYYSAEKSGWFTKDDCGSGQSGSTEKYTVQAGAYSSTVSQAAADALAQADVNANGQAFANDNGSCTTITYTVTYNAQGGSAVSGSPFTVAAGSSHQIRSSERPSHELDGWATSSGGSVDYTVGQTITVNGNITLYAQWTRVYDSVAKSGTFTRNNCGSGYNGTSVTYTVPAGAYSSTVSQAAADALAQADVNANGQAFANQNGSCTLVPDVTFAPNALYLDNNGNNKN
jgi:hypothetical protein